MSLILANFGNLFGVDGIIVLAIGLFIFGRRLPEVASNLTQAFRQVFHEVRRYVPRSDGDPILAVGMILLVMTLLLLLLKASQGLW